MQHTPVERLVLAGLEPFARGGGRDCFVHPRDPGLCVKVAREGRSPEERRRQMPWWKRWRKPAHKYDDSLRDYRTLKALESSGDAAIWQCLPRLHGWVETDRGRGLVTDLVRDADGSVSRSLLDYLRTHGHDERVQAAVDAFARFWETCPVPARSLFLDNIAAQVRDDGTLRLVVIDGLGNTVLIPWYTWSKALGLIWARRNIRFLRRDIAALFPGEAQAKAAGKPGAASA
ncbi:MAG: YrbL family protein [Gammaproteobacteria bacterium]